MPAQGKRISDDIRWAVVRMIILGCRRELIQSSLDVSERSIRAIIHIFHVTGGQRVSLGIDNVETHLGRPRALAYREIWFLCDRVSNSPDTFLDELRADLAAICGKNVSMSTVWRTLDRCGFTMKKLDRRAMERCDTARLNYLYETANYPAEYFIFVDESACDRRTTYRGRGWAIRGQRASRKCFFVRGKRYSILPALAITGVLSLQVVEGSFTSHLFKNFIRLTLGFMNPFPGPQSIIVMDNARIHRRQDILDMITDMGMRYIFLPAYSPDYNPIELTFSAIKSCIRRDGDLMRMTMSREEDDAHDEVEAKFYQHVFATTEEDAQGWFRHCGYV